MTFVPRTTAQTVNKRGAGAGCVLCGAGMNNRGIRLKVLQEQPRGHDGPLRGGIVILDVGDNTHSQSLQAVLGRVTDAEEVVRIIRQRHPGCVSVVNANILVREEG
jgi:hypothetical protein